MHTTQNIVTCKHSVSFFIRANIIIRIIDANIIVGVIRLALFVRRRFVVAEHTEVQSEFTHDNLRSASEKYVLVRMESRT